MVCSIPLASSTLAPVTQPSPEVHMVLKVYKWAYDIMPIMLTMLMMPRMLAVPRAYSSNACMLVMLISILHLQVFQPLSPLPQHQQQRTWRLP